MFRTTAQDNKANFLYVQGALAQKSNNDIAGLIMQNFDNDTKITYNMGSICIQDCDGNAQQNGRGDMVFKTSPGDSILNEAMRITHSGNVGVHTSNPMYALHVKGAVYAETYCNNPVIDGFMSLSNSTSNLVARVANLTTPKPRFCFSTSVSSNLVPQRVITMPHWDSDISTGPAFSNAAFVAPVAGVYSLHTNIRVQIPTTATATPYHLYMATSPASNLPVSLPVTDPRVFAVVHAPPATGTATTQYPDGYNFTLNTLKHLHSNMCVAVYMDGPEDSVTSGMSNLSEHVFCGAML